jgi:hypothetical protein
MFEICLVLLGVAGCGQPEEAPDPCAERASALTCVTEEGACDWVDESCQSVSAPTATLEPTRRWMTMTSDALDAELSLAAYEQGGYVGVLRASHAEGDAGLTLDVTTTSRGTIVATSPMASCSGELCVGDGATLEGRFDEETLEFALVGDVPEPFEDVRMIPHNGTKPVHNPAGGEPDPDPVAGYYRGTFNAVTPEKPVPWNCELYITGEAPDYAVESFACDALGSMVDGTMRVDEAGEKFLFETDAGYVVFGTIQDGFEIDGTIARARARYLGRGYGDPSTVAPVDFAGTFEATETVLPAE